MKLVEDWQKQQRNLVTGYVVRNNYKWKTYKEREKEKKAEKSKVEYAEVIPI